MSGFQEEVTEAPNYYDHRQSSERNEHEVIPIDDGHFDVSTDICHRRKGLRGKSNIWRALEEDVRGKIYFGMKERYVTNHKRSYSTLPQT